MAKIAYTKLGLNKMVNKEPAIVDFNGQQIEICQYLPIEKKLELISEIINSSLDDNNYYNPCRIEIFYTIEIILAYTNLTVTEKQREDIYKLYDSFVSSGFYNLVIKNIPKEEYDFIYNNVVKIIKSIYKYKNSAVGIFNSIVDDYSNLDLNASEIQSKLADPDNMELLRAVLSKLG